MMEIIDREFANNAVVMAGMCNKLFDAAVRTADESTGQRSKWAWTEAVSFLKMERDAMLIAYGEDSDEIADLKKITHQVELLTGKKIRFDR